MKGTIFAAAAGLLTAASASTSVDESTWSNWASTTTSKQADPSSSSWDPWTSSSSVSATSSSSSWSDWSATTSSASSSWTNWDPAVTTTSTSTHWVTVTLFSVAGADGSWTAWSSVGTPVAGKTTNANTVTVTGTVTKTSISSASWATWSSVSTPVAAVSSKPADPQCVVQMSLSYGEPVWHPTPVLASSSSVSVSASASVWNLWASGSSSTSAKATSTATASAVWNGWSSSAGSGSKSTASSSTATSWSAWPSSTGGSISANGNKFGMTYSPYTAAGGCKDQSTVAADVAKMASLGFSSVRVYSTDCSTLEFVGNAARSNNMKLILGVFISDTGISGAQPQVTDIVQWAQWDIVDLIVVGNEAVFGGSCTASELAGFIASSKSAFRAAGFSGSVSTTDELSVWQSQGSAWCDTVDVVTANLYAFFNPQTTAENAGAFIQAEIEALSQVCPGKEVYVMESGWPSAGECNGVACPSPENQATAIKSIQQSSGAKVVFFSFEDELWKQPGQFGVEQHWGCSDVFGW